MAKHFQERLDEAIEALEITLEEREWIHEQNRKHPKATRLVNLMAEYLSARGLSARQGLLKLLFEAVKDVRAHLQAETMVLPAGHVLVAERRLKVLQEFAAMGCVAVRVTGQDRAKVVNRMKGAAEAVLSLDPEVASEADRYLSYRRGRDHADI